MTMHPPSDNKAGKTGRERNSKGHFLKGNKIGKTFPPGKSPNPGGRPTLPAWLTGRGEELLKVQFAAAMTGRIPLEVGTAADVEAATQAAIAAGELEAGAEFEPARTQEVDPKTRMAVAESLTDRLYCRAPAAPDDSGRANGNEALAAVLVEVSRLVGERKKKPDK